MAHELNMSVTGYLHIKDVLVPKHLAVSLHSRKKQAFRRDFLQESPADNAQQNKQRQLKPLSEIETIMRHFDAKFSNAKPRQRPFFQGKEGANRGRRESEEDEVEHRLGYLLQLPVIGTVRREAERYRSKLKAEEVREREQRKAEIMVNFKQYMEAELKGHSPARKRLNTIN